MTPGDLVRLLEEMIDLKIQQHAEATMKASPELTDLLREKREVHKRRLEQIRTELVKLLESDN